MPPGTHSHKVRVANGLMVVNHEINGADPGPVPAEFKGGIGIYDVSTPASPREIARWTTTGKGVHRFDFDGRYAYLSATLEGYVGTIVLIMDLKDPARPEEVGRWWMPGQWTAGGEQPTWDRDAHRCHHPLRLGNRLYTSYWLAGFVVLDIEDMAKPKLVSSLDWSPPFHCPTHTALPLPFEIRGRRYLVVADEDVVRKETEVPAFMWMVDITDERRPVPVGSFQVEGIEGASAPNHDRLPSAVREGDGHGDPVCLVRARPAHRRRQEPARPARGGALPARCAARHRPRVEQRCHRRRSRADLSHRPTAGADDCGADVIVRGSAVLPS